MADEKGKEEKGTPAPESTVPDIFEKGGEKEYAEAVLGNDPDYQKDVKAEKDFEDKKKKTAKKETPAEGEEPEGEEALAEEASAEETGDEEKPAEGEEEKKGDEEKTETEESEFQDNILPGLTGKQFELLDEETREIVSKVHDDLEVTTKKAAEAQSQLDKLLNDPIVRHRKELIEKGQTAEEYELPEVGDGVLDNIQNLIDTDTPDSRRRAKDLIAGIQKQAAEIGSQNRGIQEQAQFESKALLKKAGENLKALGKLAKNLNVDLDSDAIVKTDLSKLGDLGKIIQSIKDNPNIKSSVRYLADTDPKELYAQMAIKHNWPLIANADKEVRKIMKENNTKMYNKFYKNKPDEASGTFPKSNEVDSRGVAKGVMRDGIDIVKLATNDEYHDTILYSKASEEGWSEKVGKLRDEGERLVSDNPRLAASRKSKT